MAKFKPEFKSLNSNLNPSNLCRKDAGKFAVQATQKFCIYEFRRHKLNKF
ncbi:MAG: hypothetical protein ACFNTA_01795 [Campylobacter sp.]